MKKSKFIISSVFVFLFLLFLFIMDYPFIAHLYNERNQQGASVVYQESVGEVLDDDRQKMLEKAQGYNARLASGTGKKILHQEYESLLNLDGDGIMGSIEIPKIGVDLMIYHGTSDEALQKGAGHLEGSSLPIGGTGTHVCISAHRGLVGKKMFTNLDELEEGDIFFLHVLGENLCYRVGDIQTVLPEETEELVIRKGEDLVTLITCTPYGINTHRLCVEGYRIPYTEDVVEEALNQAESNRWYHILQKWGWVPLSVLLIGIMCGMLYRYNRRGMDGE